MTVVAKRSVINTRKYITLIRGELVDISRMPIATRGFEFTNFLVFRDERRNEMLSDHLEKMKKREMIF